MGNWEEKKSGRRGTFPPDFPPPSPFMRLLRRLAILPQPWPNIPLTKLVKRLISKECKDWEVCKNLYNEDLMESLDREQTMFFLSPLELFYCFMLAC